MNLSFRNRVDITIKKTDYILGGEHLTVVGTDKPEVLKLQIKLEFGSVGHWGEGETGQEYPQKNLLEQRREANTNSTHI